MLYTVTFIAATSGIGWLVRNVDTTRLWLWLAGVDPLTLDQALAGPPPRRGRRWGCAAPDLVDAQRRGWV